LAVIPGDVRHETGTRAGRKLSAGAVRPGSGRSASAARRQPGRPGKGDDNDGTYPQQSSEERDKAQARLADEERKQIRHEARHERGEEGQERLAEPREIAQGKPWYRQPTVGDAIRAAKWVTP